MTMSLKERFHEVDRVPTPWDNAAAQAEAAPIRRPRPHVAAAGLVAASLAVVATLAVVQRDGVGPTPAPDASWLTPDAGACVEQYSPQTLPNRDYAFDGVIAAIDPPAEPGGTDPGGGTTTVTFNVRRWFWGGSGKEVSLRTYSTPLSEEAAESSIGAHVLASGDEDFLWACGFTKPFSESGVDEFETAAAEVES